MTQTHQQKSCCFGCKCRRSQPLASPVQTYFSSLIHAYSTIQLSTEQIGVKSQSSVCALRYQAWIGYSYEFHFLLQSSSKGRSFRPKMSSNATRSVATSPACVCQQRKRTEQSENSELCHLKIRGAHSPSSLLSELLRFSKTIYESKLRPKGIFEWIGSRLFTRHLASCKLHTTFSKSSKNQDAKIVRWKIQNSFQLFEYYFQAVFFDFQWRKFLILFYFPINF